MDFNDRVMLKTWLRQLAGYLWHTRMFFLAIVPMALICIGLTYARWTEPRIAQAGVILQVLGVFSVAYGVRETRRQFCQPSLPARMLAFISNVPKYPKRVTGADASIQHADISSAFGRLGSSGIAAHVPDVEARVSLLERQIQELAAATARGTAEVQGQLLKQQRQLDAESKRRAEAVTHLHRTLELTATGGLDLSLCGIVWLLFGSVFGTIPADVACFISRYL
jgi:hypothetical protein